MEPGEGAWVRTLRGKVVSPSEYGEKDADRVSFIPVPRAAFDQPEIVQLFLSKCSVVENKDQQAYLVYDEQGVSFSDLTSASFASGPKGESLREQVKAYYLPTTLEYGTPRVAPLRDSHLKEIFGDTVQSSVLADWNKHINARITFISDREVCDWTNRKESATILLTAAQRTWLISKGILPPVVFDPQAFKDESGRTWAAAKEDSDDTGALANWTRRGKSLLPMLTPLMALSIAYVLGRVYMEFGDKLWRGEVVVPVVPPGNSLHARR
jgi:hypothetical protein